MSMPERNLASRYGVNNSPSRARIRRILLGLLAAVFVATVVWVAFAVISGDQIKTTTVSYTHTSDSSIEVEFSVIAPPHVALSCSVEALNEHRGQVGFTVVHLAPQNERVSVHKVQVTTQQKAVSGTVKSCEAQH